MTIYTAHAPPLRGSETAYDLARFKFDLAVVSASS